MSIIIKMLIMLSIIIIVILIIILFLIKLRVNPYECNDIYMDDKNVNIYDPYNRNTLIIYAYHVKKDSTREIDNLKFLFDHGDISKVDMVLVSNDSIIPDFVPDYVKIIHRPNKGFDFPSWYDGVNSIDKNNYSNFIFINSSVKGPYLPIWFRNFGHHWTECFTNSIDDITKLVGTTVNHKYNGKYNKHVQSMLWATDKIGIDLLLKHKILSDKIYKNIEDVIKNKEIKLSETFLENGYNIKGIYMADMTKRIHDDIHYDNKYYNNTINPLETIFYKNNRINSDIIKLYDEFYNEKLKLRK
jgi:hypothetical protein